MNRLETVKSKYPDIDWDTIKTFDPSKSHKYLGWLGQNFAFADPEKLKNLILDFEKKKAKLSEKDINKYSANKLIKELETLTPTRKEEKLVGAIELTENIPKGVKVYLIEGESAAKQYCANTRWCISNFDMFLNYARDNNLFVVIKDNIKICVIINLLNTNQSSISDPQDRIISKETLEIVSKISGDSTDLLKLMKICEDFSSERKNFWADSNKGPENLEKALSLTSIDKIIKHWGTIDSLFTNEEDLDKLLKLTTVNKIFTAMTYSNVFPEKTIKFIYAHKDKYKEFAEKLSTCNKRYFVTTNGRCKNVNIATTWKSLDKVTTKNEDKELLMKKIRKLGGITKLLENQAVAKLLAIEVEKELSN